MGFDEGQIILNSPINTYYAGQTVYGKLEFNQDEVKTFRGIYLETKGYCKVHWTTSHTRRVNGQTRTYHKTHESYEQYFYKKQYLIGSDSGEHHLQPGHHEFPFECHIPPNCPSSFEGLHGRIKYSVKAVVDRAFKFDQNKKREFRVIQPLDLNAEPYCKEPMEFELLKSYCCWCMNAGSSNVLIKMPVSGYCPGQVMPIEVACSNSSSVDIKKIKFAIKRDITFHAEHEPGTKHDHDTVAELKKGPVPANTTRNWVVEMEVPAMDIINLRGCRYIDVDYEFKVSIEVGACHQGTDDSRPIVFGSIPLVGFQDDVENPLKDQMPPQPYENPQITQGVNSYPHSPIVNQPISSYPGYPTTVPNIGANPPYPVMDNSSQYPGANPPIPGANPPYPGANPPYPVSNPPYPGANPPYPGANPPYPGANPPYPGANPPYPGANPPYPGANPPYPAANPPYPGANPPYPTTNAPYPVTTNTGYPGKAPSPVPPYSTNVNTALKTGTVGFTVQGGHNDKMPVLPPGAGVPYPVSPANPYATASAPAPSSPDNENNPGLNTPSATAPTPYNPDFIDKNNMEK